MGRYADMTFIAEAEVPEGPGDLVAREAWLGRFITGAVLLGLGCGMPVFAGGMAFTGAGWQFELSAWALFELVFAAIGGLVVVVVTLVCLLAGFAFLAEGLAARRPDNWLLRAGPEDLYIKLRRFSDHRLPKDDPIVAHIPRREVRWLRAHGQLARRVGRRGEHKSHEDDALGRQSYLEIALHGQEAVQEIEARLKQERALWCPTFIKGMRSKAKGAAVSARPGGVIRIDWTTKGARLKPKLAVALAHLVRDYPPETELETEQAQAKDLGREAQEQRLLDMVHQGNTIDAVIVAKDLYGFTTTEAKRFLDELQGQ
jgi:hypothetical protein